MDFFSFAKHLKIVHPRDGLIEYASREFQTDLINHLKNNQTTILKKFRQGGFTTTILFYLLWRCLYLKDQTVLVIVKTDREIRDGCSRIINTAICNLPESIPHKMIINNDHTKLFEHTNSRIKFATPISTRGIQFNHLFIDEAAFIPNIEESWAAISTIWQAWSHFSPDLLDYDEYKGFIDDIDAGNEVGAYALLDYLIDQNEQSIINRIRPLVESKNLATLASVCCPSRFSNLIVCSTPNGRNNWFYDTYTNAINKENDFSVFEKPYQDNFCKELYGLNIEQIRLQLGEKGFRQEILAEFI